MTYCTFRYLGTYLPPYHPTTYRALQGFAFGDLSTALNSAEHF